jgi:hypothetical protein
MPPSKRVGTRASTTIQYRVLFAFRWRAAGIREDGATHDKSGKTEASMKPGPFVSSIVALLAIERLSIHACAFFARATGAANLEKCTERHGAMENRHSPIRKSSAGLLMIQGQSHA